MKLLTNATDRNTARAYAPASGADETVVAPGARLEQLVDGIARVLRAITPAPTLNDSQADPVSAIRAVAERALVPALQTGLRAMAGDLRRDLLLWVENLRAIEHLAGLGDDDLLVRLLQQPQERQPRQALPRRTAQPEPSDKSSDIPILSAPKFQPENSLFEVAAFEAEEDRPATDTIEAAPHVVVPAADEAAPETPANGQASGVESGIPLDAREQVRLYLRRAEALWRHDDQEGAVAACSRAIELAPQWAGGYLARGQIYRLRGQPTLAGADFAEAVRLRPDHAEAWLRRGDIYKETGAWEEAARDYSAALLANPRLTAAYLNRALVRARQNSWTDAVEDASAALRLDPDCRGALFIRGSAFLQLGQHAPALADLTELLQREPENYLAFNERGQVYAGLGHFHSALKDYKEALRLKPRFARARFNRAVALSLSGDVDGALASLNRLIAVHPGQAVLYCHRGRVRLARNEPVEALADFQRALAIQSNYPEAAQGLAQALDLLDPQKAAFAKLTTARTRADAKLTTARTRVDAKLTTARTRAEPAANKPGGASATSEISEISATSATANVPKTSASKDVKKRDAPTVPADARDKSKQVTITLTCLNCRAASNIRIDRLGKRFQCPKCRHVHEVDAGGQLKRITPPRSRRDAFTTWIAQNGLRAVAAAVLVLALGGGIWFALRHYGPLASLPPLPNDLEARAEMMAKAWYTGDTELVRRLTHGSQGRRLKLWMRDHQPPTAAKILSLAEKQQTKVQVHVRDEKRDTVRLELKVTHPLLPTATLDLHWVRGVDAWYFQPFPETEFGGNGGNVRQSRR